MPRVKYTGAPGTGGKRNITTPTAHVIPVTAKRPNSDVLSIILNLFSVVLGGYRCINIRNRKKNRKNSP
jgi:hypothetical protein